jgi:sugar phosphate isomerase/epimerase
MFMTLNAPAIGLRDLDLPALIALAARTGFRGIDFDIRTAEAHAPAQLRDLLAGAGILAAAWGLPVEGVQSEWQVDLDALSRRSALAERLGARRCATWVPSWHDSRPLEENAAFHVEALTPVARILSDHGIALGLEFLGPATLLQGHAHAFLRTMPAMLDLAREIGPNVGLLVDAWHLHASGGSLADLARMSARDIVHVHISDAPRGIPREALQDQVRCLPGETGVIDIVGFLRTLAAIGYEGPVVTEPFNAALNALAAQDAEAAATKVHDAMARAWKAADLT